MGPERVSYSVPYCSIYLRAGYTHTDPNRHNTTCTSGVRDKRQKHRSRSDPEIRAADPIGAITGGSVDRGRARACGPGGEKRKLGKATLDFGSKGARSPFSRGGEGPPGAPRLGGGAPAPLQGGYAPQGAPLGGPPPRPPGGRPPSVRSEGEVSAGALPKTTHVLGHVKA